MCNQLGCFRVDSARSEAAPVAQPLLQAPTKGRDSLLLLLLRRRLQGICRLRDEETELLIRVETKNQESQGTTQDTRRHQARQGVPQAYNKDKTLQVSKNHKQETQEPLCTGTTRDSKARGRHSKQLKHLAITTSEW